ncbi:MAG: hypothetical protein ACE5K7_00450 [Phycisphaerae bacterium]
MNKLTCILALGATVLLVAGPVSAQTSRLIFAAVSQVGDESWDVFDPNPGVTTRAHNTPEQMAYGTINWSPDTPVGPLPPETCSAGEQHRLNTAYNEADEDYEHFGHWGGDYRWRDPFRFPRGLIRYDEDTLIVLSGEYGPTNANGVRPPNIRQFEWRPEEPDDEQLYSTGFPPGEVNYSSRNVAPSSVTLTWGPLEGDANFLLPDGRDDWARTGGGVTGKLQIADSTQTAYVDDKDTPDPSDDRYIVGQNVIQNNRYIEAVDGSDPSTGGLYLSEIGVGYGAGGSRSASTIIDLAMFYGTTENILYTAQMEGRIFKFTGPKNLGWRRAAGQPRDVGQGGGTWPADADNGQPTLGETEAGGAVPGPYGRGLSVASLFSDAGVGLGRHYLGLAVDAGGRVYAVSERIVQGGVEVAPKLIGSGANVSNNWGNGPFRLTDASAPFGGGAVSVGDQVLITGGSFVNTVPVYVVQQVISASELDLDQDPGDSMGASDVSYRIFPSGVSPRPRPVKASGSDADVSNGGGAGPFLLIDAAADFVAAGVAIGDEVLLPWGQQPPNVNSGTYTVTAVAATQLTLDSDAGDSSGGGGVVYYVIGAGVSPWNSEAILDVYLPDGTLDASIDLNSLSVPSGGTLGDLILSDPDGIAGFYAKGDLDIDPDVGSALPADITRLWIPGADGNGVLDDGIEGLDLLCVDVQINPDGTVAGASYVGGIDDGDLNIGRLSEVDYTVVGWEPFMAWIEFSDLEFDGSGNMVYMGGRGGADNRYSGIAQADLQAAVDAMAAEAALSEDAVVSVNGFFLDMNLYGFRRSIGMCFDDSPLSNLGSAISAAAPPALIPDQGDPQADGTLPKTQNNIIVMVFDGTISLPAGNPVTIQQIIDINPETLGADLAGSFVFTLETTNVADDTLKATESGAVLSNQTWYRIKPTAGFGVQPFVLDVCTLQGDADNSGQVLALDYFQVKNNLFAVTDARYDLDGSGQVLALDYFVVKNNLFAAKPAKPDP